MNELGENKWIVPIVTGEKANPNHKVELRKKKEREELSLEDLSYKHLLTLEEANRYTGLGLQKLRDLTNGPNCQMVLWNGSKRMFKRGKLEEYLNAQYSI